jgi:hypothetical protein
MSITQKLQLIKELHGEAFLWSRTEEELVELLEDEGLEIEVEELKDPLRDIARREAIDRIADDMIIEEEEDFFEGY